MSVHFIPTTFRVISSELLSRSSLQPCIRAFHSSEQKLSGLKPITQLNKKRHFKRKQLVGFSMDQMFEVVSDVENYAKFVPHWTETIVYDKKDTKFKADLVIGFPPLKERCTSNISHSKPNLLKIECNDGKLFSNLLIHWRFSPGVRDIPQSCVIDFDASFEFKSAVYAQLVNFFFDQLCIEMEKAFINEAKNRFGKARVRSYQL